MFSLLCFFFAAFKVSKPFLCEPPCSFISFSSVESLCLQTLISSPFHLLAASPMACPKVTPNPPPSSRNPLTNTCRANPSSSRDPPRDPDVPSSQVVRPASSRPNQPQPNPPHTSAAVRPLPNYKQLYPWASSALRGETSSINTDRDILRLKKGDQAHFSFSKEHDDKVYVHPCPPEELIHKLPPRLQQNYQPLDHASRLPSSSNLARVVVSTNPYLLLQRRAFQLPSKKP